MQPAVGTVSAAVRGRGFVEDTAGSKSLTANVIVSVVRTEKSISAPRFVGLVRSCLCKLLLLMGAIARANATAGTVPCSKIGCNQRSSPLRIPCVLRSPVAYYLAPQKRRGVFSSHSAAPRSTNQMGTFYKSSYHSIIRYRFLSEFIP